MGLFDKIKKLNIFSGLFSIDEDFFEELEEALILSDMGVDTSTEAVDCTASSRSAPIYSKAIGHPSVYQTISAGCGRHSPDCPAGGDVHAFNENDAIASHNAN